MQRLAPEAESRQDMVKFQDFFVLSYKYLQLKQHLNSTQLGFHNANIYSKEQLDFPSVLENLSLADSSDKDVVDQMISSNRTLTKSKKSL